MSIFNPRVTHKEKVVSHHPWEKTIKDAYSNKIKHAHNSINNPHYPPGKDKIPDQERVKFTIIGNRVTKEFIYCANLVKGLHKYRWKSFDAPVIRGVTGVEWPTVLNDLKIEYGGLAYCLSSQVAVLYNDKFLGDDKELKELVETKYLYHLTIDYKKEAVALFSSFINATGRPCAYLHISIDSVHAGTMIFMLYNDITPNTCENFLRLCKEKKGGYGGTPVHRIVKDGWIQCGGFGLKSVPMDCENYIVPHDRRGVLGMANDGRHVDCSTQFFVLLQPAPWMAHKYVAFGQLIDGDSTLQKIESVPTWYEAPSSDIIIHQAGVLNLDCQDIMINRGANAYIQGHIEDLVVIGEIFMQELMERVWLEIEFRRIASLEQQGEGEGGGGEGRELPPPDEDHERKDIRATQRFMRKKEEIHHQLEKSHGDSKRPSSGGSRAVSGDNKDFDVESYDYEPEEYSYQHVSLAGSEPPKEERPFYIPLTDVPYPDEVDSTYDLKKFLKGDYCLESDLAVDAPKTGAPHSERKISYMSDIFNLFGEPDDSDHEAEDMDTDEEYEIKNYLKQNVDRVSFAGGVIKGIAKGAAMVNLFENHRKSELITDEILRRFRLASVDYRSRGEKKVSISLPHWDTGVHTKIKRRQTGFTRPEDLARIKALAREAGDEDDEEDDEIPVQQDRKVSVPNPEPEIETTQSTKKRRQTGFVRPEDLLKIKMLDSDDEDDDDDDATKTNVVRKISVTITLPEGAKEQSNKIKRRQTGYIKSEDMAKVSDDEEDPDIDNKENTEQNTAQNRKLSIIAEEIQRKMKRRTTAFVAPEDLEKVRIFDKASSCSSSEEKIVKDDKQNRAVNQSVVSINAPDVDEDKQQKIKRRQTGFPQDLEKFRMFGGSDDDGEDDDDDDDDTNRKDFEAKRNLNQSTVSIDAPDVDEDKQKKIKRRQTGFPQDFEKIRIFGGSDEDDDDEDIDKQDTQGFETKRASNQPGVMINAPEIDDDKQRKIKRRQTGFPQDLENIRVFGNSAEDDDEDDAIDRTNKDFQAKRSVNQSTVSINAPEYKEDKITKIKRRQTGFPEDLEKIRIFQTKYQEEESDKDEDDFAEINFGKRRTINQSAVSINAPDYDEDKVAKIKRRQTGLPSDFSKLRNFQRQDDKKDDSEDDGDDDDDDFAQINFGKRRTINQSAVSINAPNYDDDKVQRIKRRQTDVPADFEKLRSLKLQQEEDDDLDDDEEKDDTKFDTETKRAIHDTAVILNVPIEEDDKHKKIKRRQTGFPVMKAIPDDDEEYDDSD